MVQFGRVLTAMATPMTDDRAVDFDGAQRLAAHLVGHGSDGLVVCGTTGESPTLTHDETVSLFRAVAEAVGERATVVAGTGKNDTAATVELTREATATGVDAIMLVSPYYNKPSQRGLAHHFTAAAAATDLPVILYNIPSRTACEIAPQTLLDLAEGIRPGRERLVKLLLGSEDKKRNSQPATRENILAALKWVADNAEKNDLVIFGFFGQGAPLGEKGCYFAVDSNYKKRAKNAIAAGDIEQHEKRQ
jgi:hypothetical protein